MAHSIQDFLSLTDKYKGSEMAQAFEKTSHDKRLGNIRFEKVIQPNGCALFLRQNRLTPDKKITPIYYGLDLVLYADKNLNEGNVSNILIENNALYSVIGIGNIDPPPVSQVYSDANDEHLYADIPDEQIIRERIRTACSVLEVKLKELRNNTNIVASVPKTEWKKTQKIDPYAVRAAAAFKQNSRSTGQIQRTEKRA